MTTKYFKTPFANSGDKTTIPDETQSTGEVSFEEGWTVDYSNNQATDPNAKDVSRESENYFKFAITEAMKEVQETGGKPYDPLVNYPVGALIQGSDNGWYLCKVINGPDTTVVNPIGNPDTWKPLSDVTMVFTGGGSLIPGVICELQDSNTYQLPSANSIPENSWVLCELPDKFSMSTPTVTSINNDTISDVNGVDADGAVLFNSYLSEIIRFTSDGVSAWRI